MNQKIRKSINIIVNNIDNSISDLTRISEEENKKLDSIPENLEGSELYTNIERSIDTIDEAIENLESAVELLSENL